MNREGADLQKQLLEENKVEEHYHFSANQEEDEEAKMPLAPM